MRDTHQWVSYENVTKLVDLAIFPFTAPPPAGLFLLGYFVSEFSASRLDLSRDLAPSQLGLSNPGRELFTVDKSGVY